jgi:hypothetical protein
MPTCCGIECAVLHTGYANMLATRCPHAWCALPEAGKQSLDQPTCRKDDPEASRSRGRAGGKRALACSTSGGGLVATSGISKMLSIGIV